MRKYLLGAALMSFTIKSTLAAELLTVEIEKSLNINHYPFVIWGSQAVILLFGLLFSGYFAYQAFNKPAITLGEWPTDPRYMARRNQFRAGASLFVFVSLLLYIIIAFFHKELLPILKLYDEDLFKIAEGFTKNGSFAYPVVVILVSAAFVALLKVENPWNPLLVLRNVIHSWALIPSLARHLMGSIKDTLKVPEDRISGVIKNENVAFVLVEDFSKRRRTLDRMWANSSYMRVWLDDYAKRGSHIPFFENSRFLWDSLKATYDDCKMHIAPLKRGSPVEPKSEQKIYSAVQKLNLQLSRICACFITDQK